MEGPDAVEGPYNVEGPNAVERPEIFSIMTQTSIYSYILKKKWCAWNHVYSNVLNASIYKIGV